MEKENHNIIYLALKKVLYLLTTISPTLATRCIYFYHCRSFLNLKNPKTFDEKIQYLKLYINPKNKLVSKCADKVLVREYVKDKGCSEILNPIIGVFDNANDIDFDKLPDKFVIKCNHASGFNLICKDKSKLDVNKAVKKLNKWLRINYGKYVAEPHYCSIKPKLLIENFIDSNGKGLDDYRIFCFNGEPKYIKVTPEVEETEFYNYFDLNWNKVDFVKKEFESKINIKKPKNLDKMLEYARILSQGFEFVRVDLYNVEGVIYFAELTFTPTGGCCTKFTEEGAIKLGNELNIINRS